MLSWAHHILYIKEVILPFFKFKAIKKKKTLRAHILMILWLYIFRYNTILIFHSQFKSQVPHTAPYITVYQDDQISLHVTNEHATQCTERIIH